MKFKKGDRHLFLNGGSLGDVFKAGLTGAAFGAISAGVAYGIGNIGTAMQTAEYSSNAIIGTKAVLHGVTRAAITKAQGGRWSSGFWSGFATSVISPFRNSITKGDYSANVAFSAVVGGTVSEISGGKFANGAVTGAFVFMFNHALHTDESLKEYALYGKYRNVRDDMLLTANRMDDMATKYSNVGAVLAGSREFVLSTFAYSAATFATVMKHISLASIGETDWTSLTRDIAIKLGFHNTGKYSDLAAHLSNEAMKTVK